MSGLWNGNTGALSLTFDDGRVSQIDFAIPEMTKRDIFGTFFLVAGRDNRLQFDPYGNEALRLEHWRKAAALGHELGNHSMTHSKAEDIGPAEAKVEAVDSLKIFGEDYNLRPASYCYPYTESNDAIHNEVAHHYSQARAGRSARKDKFLRPEDRFDMHAITCRHIGGSDLTVNAVSTLVLEALERKSWITLMFHTIGTGDEKAQIKPFDTVSEDQFCGMLDGLLVARKAGLWVAPFGVVAENLRQNRK